MEAYKLVSANKGGPGVDDKTINEFEADLKNNLYKLASRMSSGSYFLKTGQRGRNTQENGRDKTAWCAHC